MKFRITLLCCLLCACDFAVCRAQDADASPRPTPDTQSPLLLRVENIPMGRVEASADGGAHYRLVGRVTKSAKQPDVDRGADKAGLVLRSGAEGLAFAVAPGQALKLFPLPVPHIQKKRGKTFIIPTPQEKSGIYTDLPAKTGIFGALRPGRGSSVQVESDAGRPQSFPDVFTTDERNVFVFTLTAPEMPNPKPPINPPTFREQLETLSNAYDAGALARARAAHRLIVSGVWTLHAKLPLNEPDPIVYVSYMVDDDTVATQNTPPFSFGWDTKIVPNGEHMVEIRALNSLGALVTHVRALVVVDNPK